MTPERFEQVLYENESGTLDFKKGQYAFCGATDEEKAELLKDILGLANAWRRSGGKGVRNLNWAVHASQPVFVGRPRAMRSARASRSWRFCGRWTGPSESRARPLDG